MGLEGQTRQPRHNLAKLVLVRGDFEEYLAVVADCCIISRYDGDSCCVRLFVADFCIRAAASYLPLSSFIVPSVIGK
eukprot:scaffold101190_cov58-Cyclotella_meneghiniana.AAC.1